MSVGLAFELSRGLYDFRESCKDVALEGLFAYGIAAVFTAVNPLAAATWVVTAGVVGRVSARVIKEIINGMEGEAIAEDLSFEKLKEKAVQNPKRTALIACIALLSGILCKQTYNRLLSGISGCSFLAIQGGAGLLSAVLRA